MGWEISSLVIAAWSFDIHVVCLMRWLSQFTEPLWIAWDRRLPLGRRGENAAARYLQRLGYVIVARGARDPVGELDLVAVDGRTIVFVEVKTRANHDAGHPAEAVNDEKQRRMTRLALAYLKRHDLLECRSRFDIIAVTWPDGAKRPTIEHYRDAFEAVGVDGMYG
jgi:putative endonuclease